MKILIIISMLFSISIAHAQGGGNDWAGYHVYDSANRTVKESARVVFMGNSITEQWYSQRPDFFLANNYAGRGISGQTTYQMVARFQSDVVNLSPKYVVILAGTNDIARNSGVISLKHIFQNIKSMCQIAKYNKIRPIICSVLPVYEYPWRKELGVVAESIKELNNMLRVYAEENRVVYVDLHSEMSDSRGGLPTEVSPDGVHLNSSGYGVMERIIQPVLK